MKSSTNRALVAKKQSTSFAQVANNQSISLSSALRANTPPTKGQTTSRKFLTLSIFFLLSFFCTTNAWGETATYTLNSSNNGGSVTTGNVSWSIASGAITVQNSNCKLTGTITVTLPAGATLNKVSIAKSNTWGSGATVTFKTGSTTLNTFSSSGDYTLTTNKDKLTYTFSKSGTSSKNAWVKSITVDYTVAAYRVTYDENGATSGTVPTDATSYNNGATVTVKPNSGNLAKTGYTFAGWNTKVDGTGTTYAAGTGTFTISSNTTLYAKWTANTYTVTWIVNGVTKHTNPATHGGSVTAPDVDEIPCGDVIAGWTDAKNGEYIHETSTLYEGAKANITNITSDKTFYAVFADYAN